MPEQDELAKKGRTMQLPNQRTPVAKCLELATYTAQMLIRFSQNDRLQALAQRMDGAATELYQAERTYEEARRAMLISRTGVGYEDYSSDRALSGLWQRARLMDAHGGRLVLQIFPKGVPAITRLMGESQVKEMEALEARLAAVSGIWPESEAERVRIAEHRARYAAALAARAVANQALMTARTQRNAMRERFLDVFAEVANLVKVEFPRNRMLQNLFFDAVPGRRRPRRGDADASDIEDEPVPSGSDSDGDIMDGA